MLREVLVEVVRTSGLVSIFYFFSISLTFYNKWTLSVSGAKDPQCAHAVNDFDLALSLPPLTVRPGILDSRCP